MGLRTPDQITSGQPRPPAEFGALIAEFGGKCFAATRKVTIQRDRLDTEFAMAFETPTRIEASDHRIELTCGCGTMIGWTHTSGGPDPFMYSYWDTETSVSGPHLGLIRTAADSPPCTHWHELPLRFPVPEEWAGSGEVKR